MLTTILISNLAFIALDIYIFCYGNKKYRGYLDLSDYFYVLKNPLYRNVFFKKLLFLNFLIILFNSF